MKRLERIARHYDEHLRVDDQNFAVLDWESSDAQHRRFAAMVDNISLQGLSLLDVGSGLGDLWAYLRAHGLMVDYHGVDILPEMVRRACCQHPDARFTCADVFAQPEILDHHYDVVYTSGIFNLNLDNNERFLRTALEVFFRIAEKYVVFNLLHERSPEPEARYWYTTPAKALAIVREFAPQARIIDDYLPNDFTVIATVPGSM